MLYYYTSILNDLIRKTVLFMLMINRIRLSHVKIAYFNFKTVIVEYICLKNLCNHIDIIKLTFVYLRKSYYPENI